MRGVSNTIRCVILTAVLLTVAGIASAAEPDSLADRRFIHRVGAEFRPEYVFPTNPFVRGSNFAEKPIDLSLSAHLRYSLRPQAGSHTDQIYPGVYQGLGVAYYDFGNAQELGNPAAIYLFQGARIARLSPRITFNYEWNFGLSYGWKTYDEQANKRNVVVGSKANAFLSVGFYFLWQMSSKLDLSAGFALSHFSNGNTKFPNAGVNSGGLRVGIDYNFGRTGVLAPERSRAVYAGPFPRHMSYDVVLFGSWRRKGVALGEKQIPSPESYPVAGLSFAAMYNFGYKFRAGLALDGVYDGSANVYTEDVICEMGGSCPEYDFMQPGINKQLALGVSARGEFVMPYFSVGFGLGINVLHKGGDLKQFYQMLTLKIAVTRSGFVHIGYNLRDFHEPNYLMLGLGYRFNNKYPRLR